MARRQGGYSRFVLFMKIALPLAAIGLVASAFLVSVPDDFEGAGLVFSKADLEELRSALRVKDAVFTGQSLNGDSYEFIADLVVPDSPNPSQLTVTVFRGRIDYTDGSRVDLSSPTAVIWLQDQIAEFSGGVELQMSDGYSASSERMSSNFRTGLVESTTPITATGPFGTIDAGSFRMFREQQLAGNVTEKPVILFENRVKLVFIPASGQ